MSKLPWVISPSPPIGGLFTFKSLSDLSSKVGPYILSVGSTDVSKSVWWIINRINEGKIVGVPIHRLTILVCTIRSWKRCETTDAINFLVQTVNGNLPSKLDSNVAREDESFGSLTSFSNIKDDIDAYEPPLKVLVCGDRHSSMIFEEHIIQELRRLPRYSIIVHGGCYGIDTYAGRIAEDLGFEVKVYPAQWDTYGRPAGPIRNKQMLTEEEPDMVLAFHPDIDTSTGTKNMITQAYKYKLKRTGQPPQIYINSLKRKSKFEGSFEDL